MHGDAHLGVVVAVHPGVERAAGENGQRETRRNPLLVQQPRLVAHVPHHGADERQPQQQEQPNGQRQRLTVAARLVLVLVGARRAGVVVARRGRRVDLRHRRRPTQRQLHGENSARVVPEN